MEIRLFVIFCTLYFAVFMQKSEGKLCLQNGLTCPPECCMDLENISSCCQPHRPIYDIDDRYVKTVGPIVICACLLLTVSIVICCFWYRCPLYDICRVNYTQDHIIAYPKDGDPLNSIILPDEGQNQYSPNAVKIKPVEDV